MMSVLFWLFSNSKLEYALPVCTHVIVLSLWSFYCHDWSIFLNTVNLYRILAVLIEKLRFVRPAKVHQYVVLINYYFFRQLLKNTQCLLFWGKKGRKVTWSPNEDLIAEVNQFFTNTLARHGSGNRPDATAPNIFPERALKVVPAEASNSHERLHLGVAC